MLMYGLRNHVFDLFKKNHWKNFSSTASKIGKQGFTYPAPRDLNQIIKLNMLEDESIENIKQIWTNYHKDDEVTIGACLDINEYNDFKSRAAKCPLFLIPVFRGDGYFNLLSQYQDNCILLTYLEEYKQDPASARPYLTLTLYDDLVESKKLSLLRVDIINMLDKKEANIVLNDLLDYYMDIDKFQYINNFNCNPSQFNFDVYVQEYKNNLKMKNK